MQVSSTQTNNSLINNVLTQRSPALCAELPKATPHRPTQKISLPPSSPSEYVTILYSHPRYTPNAHKKNVHPLLKVNTR
nr:MAG TPA_asm: hypothetical protein [Caudoviricetes sp.]